MLQLMKVGPGNLIGEEDICESRQIRIEGSPSKTVRNHKGGSTESRLDPSQY